MFVASNQKKTQETGTQNKTNHIKIKENFTQVVTSVQQIPHALIPKVEKELKLLDPNIKETGIKPTYWVNGLIVEKPNGKLQTCLKP